jgi:microcystin-dependent protein
MSRIIYFLITWGFLLPYSLSAQVGIGNPNPDSTSILDLTNPDNKGLLLPMAHSQAQMAAKPGMVYSFNNHIFYRGTHAYNAITPWLFKFNGDISNHVYYNLDGNIGIGFSDITIHPSAPLHIETNNPISLNSNGSLMLGRTDSTNMVFNSTEIQTRNQGTAADLTINRSGGNIELGSKNDPVNLQISGKAKGSNQSDSSYYDFMPIGAICMWSGDASNIPAGWAICDGGKYPCSANLKDSIQSPDLSGRFIVMAGDNGTHVYNPGDQGGHDKVEITMQTMPEHDHEVRDQGHSHSYSYEKYWLVEDSRGGVGRHISTDIQGAGGSTGGSGVSLYESYRGGNQSHENRPPYYALVFIIKL